MHSSKGSHFMPQKLSTRQSLAYAMPVITTICLVAPIGIVQGIYAKYFGLSLASIALVLLFARLFDAVSDPVVGYFSDRYYRRTGTYKPFILFGGLLFTASSYFLYSPPSEVGITYFALWFLAFYASWTLFEIPHMAWASRLATTSDAKAKIYSFRTSALYMGQILFFSIPLLPLFESRAITPETLKISVIIAGVLMVPFLIACLQTKEVIDTPRSALPPEKCSTYSIRNNIQLMLNNKPLLIFIAAILITYLSSGLWYSLIFLYVDVYLHMGDQFAQVFLFAFILGAVSTPVWYRCAVWFGKKITWCVATCLAIASFIYTGTLSPSSTTILELIMLKSVQTLGFTGTTVIMPAVLSEIIDFSRWKFRSNSNATYFALFTFTSKTAGSIATALGLSIAGWYGFDATTNVQSEQSIFGLTLMISWLPVAFATLSLVFIFLLPINERRHRAIRRRLDLREKYSHQQIPLNKEGAVASSATPITPTVKTLSIASD